MWIATGIMLRVMTAAIRLVSSRIITNQVIAVGIVITSRYIKIKKGIKTN